VKPYQEQCSHFWALQHKKRYRQTGTSVINWKIASKTSVHCRAAAYGIHRMGEGAHGMHYNCSYPFSHLKGDTGMNKADVSQRCTAKGQG